MLYKNVELHNVECLSDGKHGKMMSRLPEAVKKHVNPVLRDRITYFTTGCEIRFVFLGDEAVISFYVPEAEPNSFIPIMLYYGEIQSGWKWLSPLNLHLGYNEIIITRPKTERELQLKS